MTSKERYVDALGKFVEETDPQLKHGFNDRDLISLMMFAKWLDARASVETDALAAFERTKGKFSGALAQLADETPACPRC